MWCPKRARCPFNDRAVTRNPCLHSFQHHDWKGPQQTCLSGCWKDFQTVADWLQTRLRHGASVVGNHGIPRNVQTAQRPAAFLFADLCAPSSNRWAPASLKPICWRLFPRGRRRISVNIRSVPERTLFEQQACQKPGQTCYDSGSQRCWFLVEGDPQPCLHDIGIKPGYTCAAAGFNLFFQQLQEVLRNSLKQADLVTEIPLGQEKIFLSSPVSTTTALNGPTFVDDDAVLLCGDSPSQLIEKIQEATRICVDTARNFGLTLHFNKEKTEALVSWGRKGRAQVLSHAAIQEDQGAAGVIFLLPYPSTAC